MILADKIIELRKKNGWSQEELANKMDVSRQAVSKWECAQAIPDLDKLVQLGKLFGVTIDYLLKDNIENKEFTEDIPKPSTKRISIDKSNNYKLLKEAEDSLSEKQKRRLEKVYWLLLTTIYLGWSFISNAWHITWIIFPIGAILFTIFMLIYDN